MNFAVKINGNYKEFAENKIYRLQEQDRKNKPVEYDPYD